MSDISLDDCSLENLKEILSSKMRELKASQDYINGITGFANEAHITVILERVKRQTKECEEIVRHIENRMTIEKQILIGSIQKITKSMGKRLSHEILKTKSIESLRLFQMDLLENYDKKVKEIIHEN